MKTSPMFSCCHANEMSSLSCYIHYCCQVDVVNNNQVISPYIAKYWEVYGILVAKCLEINISF